jgi:hypothetical protein
VAAGGQQQIACDQASSASAAAITYTSTGMALGGAPFFNPGDGRPAYFGAPGSAGSRVTFLPPPIPTSTPISIYVPSKGYLRVDSTSDYAYVGNGTGLTPPELFYVQVRPWGRTAAPRGVSALPSRAAPRPPAAAARKLLRASNTPLAPPAGPSEPHGHAADPGGPGRGAAVAPDRPLLPPGHLHGQRDDGGPVCGPAPRILPAPGPAAGQHGAAAAAAARTAVGPQARPPAAACQHFSIRLQPRQHWAPPDYCRAPAPAAARQQHRRRHPLWRRPHVAGACASGARQGCSCCLPSGPPAQGLKSTPHPLTSGSLPSSSLMPLRRLPFHLPRYLSRYTACSGTSRLLRLAPSSATLSLAWTTWAAP